MAAFDDLLTRVASMWSSALPSAPTPPPVPFVEDTWRSMLPELPVLGGPVGASPWMRYAADSPMFGGLGQFDRLPGFQPLSPWSITADLPPLGVKSTQKGQGWPQPKTPAAPKAPSIPGSTGYADYSADTPLEQAIDRHSAGDRDLALSMRMGVLMEGGNFAGNWGVGDQAGGGSYGPYQIYQKSHGQNITPQDSLDPDKATAYMVGQYREALKQLRLEDPTIFQRDPYGAAARVAFYAERPAAMYPGQRQQWGAQELEKRKKQSATSWGQPDGAAGPPRTAGSWNHLVPGGKGKVERGGTHGGLPAVDIFAPAGTPIYAPVDGVSSPATYSLGGNATTLQGADGRWYYFAHADRPMIGGQVRKGQIIGYVGNSGNARNTPSHLHYAVASNPSVFGNYNGSGDLNPEDY